MGEIVACSVYQKHDHITASVCFGGFPGVLPSLLSSNNIKVYQNTSVLQSGLVLHKSAAGTWDIEDRLQVNCTHMIGTMMTVQC